MEMEQAMKELARIHELAKELQANLESVRLYKRVGDLMLDRAIRGFEAIASHPDCANAVRLIVINALQDIKAMGQEMVTKSSISCYPRGYDGGENEG